MIGLVAVAGYFLGYYVQAHGIEQIYLLCYLFCCLFIGHRILQLVFNDTFITWKPKIKIADSEIYFRLLLLFIPLNGIAISIYNVFADFRSIFTVVLLPDAILLFILVLHHGFEPFRQILVKHPPFFYGYLLWVLAGILSIIAVGTDYENVLRIFFQRMILPGLLLVFFLFFATSKAKVMDFISILMYGGFIYFGYTIYRYINFFGVPDIRALIFNRYNFSGNTDVYFFNSNFISGILLLLIALSIYKLIEDRKNTGINLFIIFIFIVNLLFCFSRGGILTLAVMLGCSILFYVSLYKAEYLKWVFLAGGIVGVMIFTLFAKFSSILLHFTNLFSPTGSGTARLNMWLDSLDIFMNHWFLGYGFGEFGIYYAGLSRDANTHNLFLNMMLDSGIFGILGFMMMLVYVLIITIKTVREEGRKVSNLIFVTICGLVVIFLMGTTTGLELDFLSTTWSVYLVFIILGCSLKV